MNALSGRMEAGRHVLALRVYYEDTDAAGMVYYANYLRYAERGRTELLRQAGFGHRDIAERYGLAFVVRDCRVAYRRPARLDDLIEVRSRLTDMAGASFAADQRLARDGTELARLEVRLACLAADGRPARIPEAVRRALAPFCQPDTPPDSESGT